MILFSGSRFYRRSDQSVQLRKANPEVTVSRYFEDYADGSKPVWVYMLQRLRKTIRMLISLYQLPCLRIVPSAAVEGAAIRARLLRHPALWRLSGFATPVLSLPPGAGQYSLGASKQTLRRKVRLARRLGIHWTEVDDPRERLNLLKLANEYEQTHPNVTYRNPNPGNGDLLSYRLWLVARAADGRPLLLSVTPVDGELALLRYFRTLGTGEEQSHARYFMTEVLAERLVRLGVHYLADGSNLFWLPDGLRHFQRMVGFRIVRIRIARPGRFGVGGTVRDGLDAHSAQAGGCDRRHADAPLAKPRT
jgi:hypothetical protein